jgi:hypothetical protein
VEGKRKNFVHKEEEKTEKKRERGQYYDNIREWQSE